MDNIGNNFYVKQTKTDYRINKNFYYTCPAESTNVINNIPPVDIVISQPQVIIGDTAEIPKSVIYNPIDNIKYAVLKYGDFEYKVEDNKGVNRTNASNEDVCLALYAEAIADEISNVGACYTGVKKAFYLQEL